LISGKGKNAGGAAREGEGARELRSEYACIKPPGINHQGGRRGRKERSNSKPGEKNGEYISSEVRSDF